jgi:DNA polymerase III epsilon subunit-like protein
LFFFSLKTRKYASQRLSHARSRNNIQTADLAAILLFGRVFKMPKMCTVASMRKLYPGHASYSLKNLCREYNIDRNSHHRALCDAKAAAEFLFLINEKRAELAKK